MRNHTLQRAHADVEVHPQSGTFATEVVFPALAGAMRHTVRRNAGAVECDIKIRPVGEIEKLSDDAGIVDVVRFDGGGVYRTRRPGLKYLIAWIVRRQIRPKNLSHVEVLVADSRMNVRPYGVIWIGRGIRRIQTRVARCAGYAKNARAAVRELPDSHDAACVWVGTLVQITRALVAGGAIRVVDDAPLIEPGIPIGREQLLESKGEIERRLRQYQAEKLFASECAVEPDILPVLLLWR